MAELNAKKRQNRRYALTEKQLLEWDQLYCIVHDKDLVMHKRITSKGKVIRYLDFK